MAVGDEAAIGFRNQGDAVRAGRLFNVGDDLSGICLKNQRMRLTGDIEQPGFGIKRDVIPAPVAADVQRFSHLIRRRGRTIGKGENIHAIHDPDNKHGTDSQSHQVLQNKESGGCITRSRCWRVFNPGFTAETQGTRRGEEKDDHGSRGWARIRFGFIIYFLSKNHYR